MYIRLCIYIHTYIIVSKFIHLCTTVSTPAIPSFLANALACVVGYRLGVKYILVRALIHTHT